MKSESSANWDITTACDIRLGQYFQNNTPSCYLDISATTIEATLDKLDPGSKGRLYFEAVHDDHPKTGKHLRGRARKLNKVGDQSDSKVWASFPGEGDYHATAVHELQHVVDHGDTSLMRQRRRRAYSAVPVLIAGALTVQAALTGIAYETIDFVTKDQTIGVLGAMGVAYATTYGLMRGGIQFMTDELRHRYVGKELEARANTAEGMAYTLPPIMSIKLD